jgi:hypothetical protein
MRNVIRSTHFAAIVLLASCGSSGAIFETRDARLQAVKTVGIISAIGDQFTFAKGGFSGPDNTCLSLSISSWGLDDFIVRQTTAALSGRFQVRPLTYNRAAFAAIKESPIKAVTLVHGDPFKKLVETEVSPQGLDAYVVITRSKANFGSGAHKLEGVGLITYGTLVESYSFAYALYEIRVVDGKTFDIIEKMAAGPLDDAEVRVGGPSRPADESLVHCGSPDEALRKAIVDLIDQSLPEILSDMHLR